MNTSEFNAQKIEPIKNELIALGWSVEVNNRDIVEFKRDSVLVYFTPENYTNKKYVSRVYPVGVDYRDLSYSLKHEFLHSLKSRNVTEKTKPNKIIDHLHSLYDECLQAFNDELETQNKIKTAEKERVENLERVRSLFGGRSRYNSVEFKHGGSRYGNSITVNSNSYDLQLSGLSLDQLIAIKNILGM